MNQVVNFLSLLAVTEEQGGVKRMLGVCAEFERIARVVLERSEKESNTRRKRRSSKISETDASSTPQQVPEKRAAPPTPQSSNHESTPRNVFTPGFSGDLNNQPFNPNLQGFSPSLSNTDFPIDFSGADFNANTVPSSLGMDGFPNSDVSAQTLIDDGLNMGSFQQPFVPQDLWQMPMTLEWDWADMGNGAGTNGFPAAFDAGHDHNADMDGQGSV